MGINTDLSVNPYYDDFDETKQFNKVLFKPAKAVQARELTQLQTILQKQVERFGSNVYKEGTIISGINLTARDDINFVKLNDQAGFNDPSIYNEVISNATGDKTTFTVTGQTSGLVAEIIRGKNGFQTQDPDLKTFFINYTTTTQNDSLVDVKEFIAGETLDIKNSSGTIVDTISVSSAANHAGKSFGISCDEGVIYQKGHFIFVDDQFIIVSKYSNVPGTVSVGFTVTENLINSSADSSLLDNASGFNNENAPGADRLQLVPTLVSYSSSSEPTEFFSLIRYENGKPVRLRQYTEFNSIEDTLARRTYEESGNYVTSGLNISLEQIGNESFAVVAPGKAYVSGREIVNVSAKKLAISPTTNKQIKTNQYTGISYGQYLTIATTVDSDGIGTAFNATGGASSTPIGGFHNFNLDGTRYKLMNGNTHVATCSVSNVVASFNDANVGRVYVYAIVSEAGQETAIPTTITTLTGTGSTTILGTSPVIFDSTRARRIFDAGKSGMNSITNAQIVQRKSVTKVSSAITTDASNSIITLAADSNVFPQVSDIFAIKNNVLHKPSEAPTVDGNGTVTVKFNIGDLPADSIVYYSAIVSSNSHDSLEEKDVFVKANLTGSIANIGLPNAIQLISVTDNSAGSDVQDVTGKFRLVNNQKDTFYDLSYIQLKSGESIESSRSALTIKVKVLSRNNTGAGYLTADSYFGVSNKQLVKRFVAKDNISYNLINGFDFRPYASPQADYAIDASGASDASSLTAISFAGFYAVASDSVIASTQQYYLSRTDTIVADEYSSIKLIKGTESENPSSPSIGNQFPLSNVFVPNNVTKITGEGRIKLKDLSVDNYTMRDIGQIEQKVNSLVELVSLSLLEQSTKSLLIKGSDGLDRFKNGILADSFRDFRLSELTDPEFRSALDSTRTVATPAVRQFSLDLTYLDSDSSTAQKFKNLATIAVGNPVTIIEQPYATNFRNCVTNFYSYSGKSVISPPFDSGYDVVQNPAVDFEIDVATPILDLVNNLQEYNPMTKEDIEVISSSDVRVSQTETIRTEQLEVTTTSLSSSVNNFNTAVGNFVTDLNMKPYVRSREMKIFVTGLRPNTRHYFYFQETDINAHVYPGTISATSDDADDVQISGLKNDTIRTDANGTLTAVFKIPEATFFVGENILEIADVDTYSSISSAKTSYSRASYRAYNFSVNKSEFNISTRTVDFDTDIDITDRVRQISIPEDPIAQTFRIKRASTNGSSTSFIKEIDVYFKRKDLNTGITLEVREVVNGYPSDRVVPFGKKHLTSANVLASDNSTSATTFTFDDPVILNTDSEYCFVLKPDANSPEYLLWTSKVGGTDVNLNASVTNDWGDGVLFTSTNDSAWKSYQDEDAKFTVRQYSFQDSTLAADAEEYVTLAPNSPEFFTIRENSGNFENDELAYVVKNITPYGGAISTDKKTLTISSTTLFTETDYVYIESGTHKFLSKISNKTGTTPSVITLETPYTGTATSVSAYVCTAGRVSYYNKNSSSTLHLRGSSSRDSNYFGDNAAASVSTVVSGKSYTVLTALSTGNASTLGASSSAKGTVFTAEDSGTGMTQGTVKENNQQIIGYNSGATAIITTVDDESISYFQPQIYTSNTNLTSSEFTLMNGSAIDRPVPQRSNTYMSNNERVVKSASNRAAVSGLAEDFKIRIAMNNSGFTSCSPVIDFTLSELNVYKYDITNSAATSSKWISKEVVLDDELYADGLKVLLAAYRPPGTKVEVYGRFRYPTNIENLSAWSLLVNKDESQYSNVSNTRDYREFEYDFTESAGTNNYASFQLKIVMRHMTESERTSAGLTNLGTPGINLFPHVYDYRAIALT